MTYWTGKLILVHYQIVNFFHHCDTNIGLFSIAPHTIIAILKSNDLHRFASFLMKYFCIVPLKVTALPTIETAIRKRCRSFPLRGDKITLLYATKKKD